MKIISKRDKKGDVQKQHRCFAKNKGEMTFFLLNKANIYSKYEFPQVEYFSKKIYGH